MTKTTVIEIDSNTTVYILNNYKCFAKANGPIESSRLSYLQQAIEDKMGVKILMVRFDEILNVVEFYII
jgi:hypothetical protein